MFNMTADRNGLSAITMGKNRKVTISPKLIAANHAGWEVQEYNQYHGWKRAQGIPVVQSQGVAEMLKEEIQVQYAEKEFRVYEALQ